MLVAVLFTVGAGLLLMGVQAGHRVLFSDDGICVEDGLWVNAATQDDDGAWVTQADEGQHMAHLPKVYHGDGQRLQAHKYFYKRIRGRSGPDVFYSIFGFCYFHPQMMPLPASYGASIHAAIQVTSFLRGPPVA